MNSADERRTPDIVAPRDQPSGYRRLQIGIMLHQLTMPAKGEIEGNAAMLAVKTSHVSCAKAGEPQISKPVLDSSGEFQTHEI